MKIIALSSTYPRWTCDSRPRFAHDLARHLVLAGHEVLALAPHHPGAKFRQTMDGVDVIRFPYFIPIRFETLACSGGIRERMRHSLLARFQLPLLAVSELVFLFFFTLFEGPDVIHAQWILPQGLNAVIIGRFLRKQVVVSVHGADIFPLKSKLLRCISKMVLTRCDVVTANSKATKEAVDKLAGGNVNVRIIPMGVDTESFRKMCDGRQDILFVGRLAEKKGVKYLIRAFDKISGKHQGTKLIIVGEGDELGRLIAEAKKSRFKDSISFEGAKDHDKLKEYFQKAGVFVMPSIIDSEGDTEGLGVAALEAMASGVPVVTSNVGGIPDVIKDGINGLLTAPEDPNSIANAVVRLLDDKKMRDNLSEKGRITAVERFSWSMIAKEFEKVYEIR